MKRMLYLAIIIGIVLIFLIAYIAELKPLDIESPYTCKQNSDCVEFCDTCVHIDHASRAECGFDDPNIVLTCVCGNNMCISVS